MNVLSFDGEAEMQAYLIQARLDAAQSIHPLQSALTNGSYWCRFVDLAARIVEFGRVAEQHEVVDSEVAAGATKREALAMARQTQLSLENGYLYGIAYSLLNREGEWGITHKKNVWPIEEELMFQAAEANWQIDLLPASGKVNLQAAFTAYRGRGQ